MITVKIEEDTKQAKQLIKFLKTLSFVIIEDEPSLDESILQFKNNETIRINNVKNHTKEIVNN